LSYARETLTEEYYKIAGKPRDTADPASGINEPTRLTLFGCANTLGGWMLKRTPLHEFHVACGAKLVDFAGWEMPILYRGIVEEHLQTRVSGSLFDVSHMGRIHLTGAGAVALLDKVLTRNVSQQRVGQSRYSLVCNPAGGVLDDVIVSKHPKHWLIVCNASNREKIVRHVTSVRDADGFDAEISDQTESTAMVALQGPAVVELISEALDVDVKSIKRYGFESGTYMLSRFTLFRSGYTGEDGVEIIVSNGTAQNMVKSMSGEMSKPDSPIKPAGLGARDTLRLEAGMPLYGHELDEITTPIEAGLGFFVALGKGEFIGRPVLAEQKLNGVTRNVVAFVMAGKSPPPRPHYPIWSQGAAAEKIGEVASGTQSPTLGVGLGMACLPSSFAQPQTPLAVEIRGRRAPALVVPKPFYRKPG